MPKRWFETPGSAALLTMRGKVTEARERSPLSDPPAAPFLRKRQSVGMQGRWLYILRCRDGAYYVGTTAKDPETRASEHQNGLDPDAWTYKRRPVSLVHTAFYASIHDAVAAERRIKGWRREKKEALIRGDYEALPDLARRGPRNSRDGVP